MTQIMPPHADGSSSSSSRKRGTRDDDVKSDSSATKLQKVADGSASNSPHEAEFDQKSMHEFLKGEMEKLCETLELSMDIKRMVGAFLDYVMKNHFVSKEPAPLLHSFQLSLCWAAAKILKKKMSRRETLIRAKNALQFQCTDEEAYIVYEKLRDLMKTFQRKNRALLPSLIVSGPQGIRKQKLHEGHPPSTLDVRNVKVDGAEGSRSLELLKGLTAGEMNGSCLDEHINELQKQYEEDVGNLHKRKAQEISQLESDHRIEAAFICNTYPEEDVTASGMLTNLDNDIKLQIQEHENLVKKQFEELQTRYSAKKKKLVDECKTKERGIASTDAENLQPEEKSQRTPQIQTIAIEIGGSGASSDAYFSFPVNSARGEVLEIEPRVTKALKLQSEDTSQRFPQIQTIALETGGSGASSDTSLSNPVDSGRDEVLEIEPREAEPLTVTQKPEETNQISHQIPVDCAGGTASSLCTPEDEVLGVERAGFKSVSPETLTANTQKLVGSVTCPDKLLELEHARVEPVKVLEQSKESSSQNNDPSAAPGTGISEVGDARAAEMKNSLEVETEDGGGNPVGYHAMGNQNNEPPSVPGPSGDACLSETSPQAETRNDQMGSDATTDHNVPSSQPSTEDIISLPMTPSELQQNNVHEKTGTMDSVPNASVANINHVHIERTNSLPHAPSASPNVITPALSIQSELGTVWKDNEQVLGLYSSTISDLMSKFEKEQEEIRMAYQEKLKEAESIFTSEISQVDKACKMTSMHKALADALQLNYWAPGDFFTRQGLAAADPHSMQQLHQAVPAHSTQQHQSVPPNSTQQLHQAVPAQSTQQLHQSVPAQSTQQLHRLVPAQSTQQLHRSVPAQSTQQLHRSVPAQSTQQLHRSVSPQSTQQLHRSVPAQSTQQLHRSVPAQSTQQLHRPVPPQSTQQLHRPVPPPHSTQQLHRPVPPPHSTQQLHRPVPPPHSTQQLHRPVPPPHSTQQLHRPVPPPHSTQQLHRPVPPPNSTQQLHRPVPPPNSTQQLHRPVPPPHSTQQLHRPVPPPNSTQQLHRPVPPPNSTQQLHRPVPPPNSTQQLHRPVPPPNSTQQLHRPVPPPNSTQQLHRPVPPPHSTQQLHRPVPPPHSTQQLHRLVPPPNSTQQLHRPVPPPNSTQQLHRPVPPNSTQQQLHRPVPAQSTQQMHQAVPAQSTQQMHQSVPPHSMQQLRQAVAHVVHKMQEVHVPAHSMQQMHHSGPPHSMQQLHQAVPAHSMQQMHSQPRSSNPSAGTLSSTTGLQNAFAPMQSHHLASTFSSASQPTIVMVPNPPTLSHHHRQSVPVRPPQISSNTPSVVANPRAGGEIRPLGPHIQQYRPPRFHPSLVTPMSAPSPSHSVVPAQRPSQVPLRSGSASPSVVANPRVGGEIRSPAPHLQQHRPPRFHPNLAVPMSAPSPSPSVVPAQRPSQVPLGSNFPSDSASDA